MGITISPWKFMSSKKNNAFRFSTGSFIVYPICSLCTCSSWLAQHAFFYKPGMRTLWWSFTVIWDSLWVSYNIWVLGPNNGVRYVSILHCEYAFNPIIKCFVTPMIFVPLLNEFMSNQYSHYSKFQHSHVNKDDVYFSSSVACVTTINTTNVSMETESRSLPYWFLCVLWLKYVLISSTE